MFLPHRRARGPFRYPRHIDAFVARLPQSDVSARRCEFRVTFLGFETDWAPVSFVSAAGGGAPDREGRHERPGPVQAARPMRRGARSAGRDGLSGHGDRAALGKGTTTQGPEGSPIGRAQPPAGRPLFVSVSLRFRWFRAADVADFPSSRPPRSSRTRRPHTDQLEPIRSSTAGNLLPTHDRSGADRKVRAPLCLPNWANRTGRSSRDRAESPMPNQPQTNRPMPRRPQCRREHNCSNSYRGWRRAIAALPNRVESSRLSPR
ncbi:Uncharacterised protein [Rhodococcus gordoniae]|uniref:Uncharacterized protein n=1 Tax=Rhodococcus gordoniae TaxID=223392 RepID=A0A379M0C9_9NOCA|nr:Uncharacterised protein [Rhodococcus gordoniae]